jgi:serine/threonine-protein kinase RsbW
MGKSIEQGSIEVVIPSDTRYLHMVANLTRSASLLAGFPQKTCEQMALAVDEAVTNVIRHSYSSQDGHQIQIGYTLTVDALRIDIRHGGDQVDLTAVEKPDLEKYIAERRRGGLGLTLMNKLMDRVEFDQSGSMEHECCMWKYRTPSGTSDTTPAGGE